jgi:hypothetical protein
MANNNGPAGGGGGGQNGPCVLGTLFYEGVQFERVENWSLKMKIFIFFFISFYSPLFNSVTKKIPRLKKFATPLPPQFTPMHPDIFIIFIVSSLSTEG